MEVKPKKGRTMSAEMLEKLKIARELALKSKREGKKINEEHEVIKNEIKKEPITQDGNKKESFSQKVNEIETYKKIKEKVDEEVKKNEIVSINKKLEDLHNKFEGYLQEKTVRRQQKTQAKEEMTAKEIVKNYHYPFHRKC